MNLNERNERDAIRSLVDSFVTHKGTGRGLNAAELIMIQSLGELATSVLRRRVDPDARSCHQ